MAETVPGDQGVAVSYLIAPMRRKQERRMCGREYRKKKGGGGGVIIYIVHAES